MNTLFAVCPMSPEKAPRGSWRLVISISYPLFGDHAGRPDQSAAEATVACARGGYVDSRYCRARVADAHSNAFFSFSRLLPVLLSRAVLYSLRPPRYAAGPHR